MVEVDDVEMTMLNRQQRKIQSLEAERDTLKAENAKLREACKEANDALCTIQGLSWDKLTNTERGKIKRAIAILHGKQYQAKQALEVRG